MLGVEPDGGRDRWCCRYNDGFYFVLTGWWNHWEVWTLITQKYTNTACSGWSGINSSLSIIGPGGNYSLSCFCVSCFSTIYWLSVDNTLPGTLCRIRQIKVNPLLIPKWENLQHQTGWSTSNKHLFQSERIKLKGSEVELYQIGRTDAAQFNKHWQWICPFFSEKFAYKVWQQLEGGTCRGRPRTCLTFTTIQIKQ